MINILIGRRPVGTSLRSHTPSISPRIIQPRPDIQFSYFASSTRKELTKPRYSNRELSLRPDASEYANMMNELVKSQDTDRVLELFYEMKQHPPINTDERHYTSAIKVLSSTPSRAEELVTFLEQAHKSHFQVKLNEALVFTTLNTLKQEGKVDLLLKLFGVLQSVPKSITLNDRHYSCVLGALSQEPNRIEELMSLFSEIDVKRMKKADSMAIVFTQVLSALGKANKLDEMIKIFRDMEREPYLEKPNAIHYGCVINGLGQFPERIQDTIDIFNEMEKKKVSIDSRTFTNLFRALEKAGRGRGATQLMKFFRKMQRPPHSITPEAEHYKLLFRALIKSELFDDMTSFFTEMKQKRLHLDKGTFFLAMVAFGKGGRLDEMTECITAFQRPPYSELDFRFDVTRFLDKFKSLEALLKLSRTRGVLVNNSFLTTVMHQCELLKAPADTIEEVWKEAIQTHRVQPDMDNYWSKMRAFIKTGRWMRVPGVLVEYVGGSAFKGKPALKES